jgi:hypothetical protein
VGESYALAKAHALPEGLKSGKTKETAVALPKEYRDTAKEVSQRRIAIAGYRLADLLREIALEREGN